MRFSLLFLAAFSLVLFSSSADAQERFASNQQGSEASMAPLVDVIADGSFEGGTPNAAWNEASTNFGTPICDVGACGTGTGTGPNTGAFWTWLGGISTYEEGSVDQDVVLSVGTAELTFWLEMIVCDSASDYMEVTVDGNQEFVVFGDDAACGTLGYAQHTVNLDAYADGNSHNIAFHSEIFAQNAGGTNFFIDDVVLDNIPVPVELTGFNATISGSSVNLDWQTASETNNAGFEVQMQNGDSWTALGFVEGNGTTTEAQNYNFSADLGVGTHTFRLKQIDYDGGFEYHGNIEATIETPGSHVLSAAYPNPFNPQSQFTLSVAQEQLVTAELYNTLGQRVATLFNGTVEANQIQNVTIDGAGLASGLYIVRVNGESFTDALRVTLLK